MKKTLAWILTALLLTTACFGAFSEGQKAPDFILEGFDGENSNRNWETNLFFERMEEKNGITFQFTEYTNYTRWQERKKAIENGEDLPDVLFKAELNASEVWDLYEAGILIGRKAGTKLSGKAAILGGIVLIAIGIKMVVSGS